MAEKISVKSAGRGAKGQGNPMGMHRISLIALVLINVAAIASLRGLPSMAEYGLSSIFFYILAALLFFIPAALVSAELATGWAKTGGVYVWVKEAFGERFGFMAIWLQWIQNVVWYPTALSFTAATLAYAFNPQLASNSLFMVGVILTVYWGATFLNLRGLKTSGRMISLGALAGTLLPGILLIILAAAWLGMGKPSQIDLSLGSVVPDLSNFANIVLAAGVLLAFAGIEMSAVHAQEVKNPKKDYPRAIFTSVAIILGVFVLGTLAIAIVVPNAQISLVAGIMESFTTFLTEYGIAWLIPVIALLIVLGTVGQISAWISGPPRGILKTAKDGCLPPFFAKTNEAGMPRNLLLFQGCIVTAISLVFLLMPDVSSSYWLITALTAQVYLLMYVIMFAAAIKLRYSRPDVERAYTLPGGMMGMWLIAGMGLLAALFGIGIGFVPPSQLQIGSILFYESFLVAGLVIMAGAPLLIHYLRKPSWIKAAQSA